MPLYADLYLDRIDLARHAGSETCQVCRVDSLEELLDRLRSGKLCGGRCPHWSRERVEAFRTAIDAGKALPSIPSLSVPRPTEAGWFEVNEPTREAQRRQLHRILQRDFLKPLCFPWFSGYVRVLWGVLSTNPAERWT